MTLETEDASCFALAHPLGQKLHPRRPALLFSSVRPPNQAALIVDHIALAPPLRIRV
jgi:hypothetical protein